MIKTNVFGWGLTWRVALLLTFSISMGVVFLHQDWVFTLLVLLILLVITTINLYQFISKTNRDVSRFLEAIHYEEFNQGFSENASTSFKLLAKKMNSIKNYHEKKLTHFKSLVGYYERILDEVDEGVLLFDENLELVIKSRKVDELLHSTITNDVYAIERVLPGFVHQVIDSTDYAELHFSRKNYTIGQDLTCMVRKFIVNSKKKTLVFFIQKTDQNDGGAYDTWINFSKVISHEILNGISPILSLTSTMKEKVNNLEGNEKFKTSMQEAISVIDNRVLLLQKNSERYRTLNRLPEPKKTRLIWNDLLGNVKAAFQKELQEQQIALIIKGDSLSGSFKGDKAQLDQVFSNLMLNSMHAFDGVDLTSKNITIDINEDQFKFIIKFSDNGRGIDKNIRGNVFLPFYSTRETGSGIGLSVVKQLLWKHQSEIFLTDVSGGTCFTIYFPKV